MSIILVVDDHESIRRLVQALLTKNGYTVWTADHGLSGLRLVEEVRPDLVVLDVRMPILDGNGFLDGMNKIERPKIIAVTGYTSDLRDDLLGWVDGVLQKPFRNDQLVRIVREVLGHH